MTQYFMPLLPDDLSLLQAKTAQSAMMRKAEDHFTSRIAQSLGVPSHIFTGESSFSSSVSNADSLLRRFDPLGGLRFGGLALMPCPYMADYVQYRFPRSKKKRIRKKWSKDKRNWRWEPWKKAWQIGDMVFAHPSMIESIKKATNQGETP